MQASGRFDHRWWHTPRSVAAVIDNVVMLGTTHRSHVEVTPLGGLGEGGLQHLLGYQLAQAAIATAAVFERMAGGPLGLRPVEFTLLQLVQENGSVTPTRLARALAMTVPGVTGWIDRLERRGLLCRQRSQTDRRAQLIGMTDAGRQQVEQALAQLLSAEADMLAALSPGERLILLELLHKVACSRPR